MTNNSISIVIPVYNSSAIIPILVEKLLTVSKSLTEKHEIILVNDGSRDESWQVICEEFEKNSHVHGINLMRNYGQHNALLAGIKKAQHDIIITIDDDLQNPPEEIPRLVEKLNEGYDIVYGRPKKRKHRVWRTIFSHLLKTILRLAQGTEVGSHSSSFRAFKRRLCKGFEEMHGPYVSIDVLLSWSIEKVTHIRVQHNPSSKRSSRYTLTKLTGLAITILTGYSTFPLRLASGLGLLTSGLGFATFFFVAIRRLFQTSYTPGFAFLASEIAFFAGLQLFAIGIIGEYLAKLHFRSMGKPPYVIKEETS